MTGGGARARRVDEPGWVCEDCPYCVGQPDCYDCLECMGAVPEEPDDSRRARRRRVGPSSRLRTSELAARRASLGLTEVVGLAVRRARAEAGWSQRALAKELGWSKSRLARLETQAGALSLSGVATALARCGYQLAILEDGVPLPPTTWSTPELLDSDRAGRRVPAHGEVTVGPGDPSSHRRGPDGLYVIPEWRWRQRP